MRKASVKETQVSASANGVADVDLIPKAKKKSAPAKKASVFGPKALWDWYERQAEEFNGSLNHEEDEEWSRNSLMVYALQRYQAEVEEARAAGAVKKPGKKRGTSDR
jgi:hypothetical protein